jgi:RimJ/RimL family protein N-acetyltransferase
MDQPLNPIVRVSVYDRDDADEALYNLLSEREDHVNISHKAMPTWEQHCAFFESRPYKTWELILAGGEIVGACYVTKQNEIGIFIFAAHQRQGYAAEALHQLINEHKGERLLANIAPGNQASIALFASLGFRHIQNTYALDGNS